MAKGRVYDPDWVIQDDEFHPNHGVAAKHADLRSHESARDYHRAELRRLEAKPKPLVSEQLAMDGHRLALADAERRILEHNEEDTDGQSS